MELKDQILRIERFSFLPFKGPIDLKDPDVIFTYFEDYGTPETRGPSLPEQPTRVLFGVLVRIAAPNLTQDGRDHLGNCDLGGDGEPRTGLSI